MRELINIQEIWKPVVGYEGLYEVSNYGVVRGLTRECKDKNGNKHVQNEKILSKHDNGKGYLTVRLGKNGILKSYYIHRIVADAFIPNPNNLPEVNHKDENKGNNCVTNLEWISHIDNVNYGTANYRKSKEYKINKHGLDNMSFKKTAKSLNSNCDKNGKLITTQSDLIKCIADREDIDVATVRNVFESAEDIIFDHLSSTSPHEDIIIKLLNGFDIERTFIKKKKYSKGMFKNIECPERIKVKASSSKYFTKRVNEELCNKNLLN